MIPNRHRGEAVIRVEGKELLIRGTFEALCKIEDIKPGRYLRQFILDLREDNVSLKELVQVVHVSLVDEQMELNKLGDMLAPIGVLELAGMILPVLEFGLAGRSIGDWPEYQEPDQKEVALKPTAYPFRRLLGYAQAQLQWSEDEFYNSTPQALFSAMQALEGKQELTKEEQDARQEKWYRDTEPLRKAAARQRAKDLAKKKAA